MSTPFHLEPTFGLLMSAVLGWWCLVTSRELYRDYIKNRLRGDLLSSLLLFAAGVAYFIAAYLYFQELGNPTSLTSDRGASWALWGFSEYESAQSGFALRPEQPQFINAPGLAGATQRISQLDHERERPLIPVNFGKQLIGQGGHSPEFEIQFPSRFYSLSRGFIVPATMCGLDICIAISCADRGRFACAIGPRNNTTHPPIDLIHGVVRQRNDSAIHLRNREIHRYFRHPRSLLRFDLLSQKLGLLSEKTELLNGVLDLPLGFLYLREGGQSKQDRAKGHYKVSAHIPTSIFNPNSLSKPRSELERLEKRGLEVRG